MSDTSRQLVFCAHDHLGTVKVWQGADGLVLDLGQSIEQTRLMPHNRQHLCFAYMRQMLLTLIWRPKPRRALLLGLGGGALAHHLLNTYPKLTLDAVELRPAVVQAAYDVFGLPKDTRLQVHMMDAENFVHHAPQAHYDLIFTDLFDAHGMVPLLGKASFHQDCARLLAPRGVMAANLWRQPLDDYLAATIAMEQAFPWLAFSPIPERGQSVAFAAWDFPGHVRELERLARKHALDLGTYWHELVRKNPRLFKGREQI